uniref:Uncharacterized protein n=1 Tax=Ditylenchus dipsaci TaxID=166011 RepID=A0A915D0F2_9BILA
MHLIPLINEGEIRVQQSGQQQLQNRPTRDSLGGKNRKLHDLDRAQILKNFSLGLYSSKVMKNEEFAMLRDEKGLKVAIRCLACSAIFSPCVGGHLNYHRRNACPGTQRSQDQSREIIPKAAAIQHSSVPSASTPMLSPQVQILDSVTRMCALDEISPSILLAPGFHQFLKCLVNQCNNQQSSDCEIDHLLPHPSLVWKHVRRQVQSKQPSFRHDLNNRLKSCGLAVSLQSEAGKWLQTAHFIADDWTLQSIPLETLASTSENLAEEVKSSLNGMGLANFEAVSIVLPEGSCVDTNVRCALTFKQLNEQQKTMSNKKKLYELLELFQPLLHAVDTLNNSKAPTIHKVLPVLQNLKHHFQQVQLKPGCSTTVQVISQSVLDLLNQESNGLLSDQHYFALILDPSEKNKIREYLQSKEQRDKLTQRFKSSVLINHNLHKNDSSEEIANRKSLNLSDSYFDVDVALSVADGTDADIEKEVIAYLCTPTIQQLELRNIFTAFCFRLLPSHWHKKKSVEGKLVLITGAGGAIAANLETANICRQLGVQAYCQSVDVGDRQAIYTAADSIQKYTNGNFEADDVDILVNNAGIISSASFLDTEDDRIEKLFRINMTIAGKQIPAGTTIMPQIGAVLYDEHLFPDPDTFKPERFIDKVKNTYAPSKYLKPFGVGKRACLGESLARMELSIVFASMIQNFNFEAVDPACLPSLARLAGMASKPNHFKCRISQRRAHLVVSNTPM